MGRQLAVTLTSLLFLCAPPVEAACPKIPLSDGFGVGKEAIKQMASDQVFGASTDADVARYTTEGKIVGGNSYDLLASMNWPESNTAFAQTLLTAHPMTVVSGNPFSIPLSFDRIQCLLRENVRVLLSDNVTHHFTGFWRVNPKTRAFSVADQHPDNFFLASGYNHMAIVARRARAREGVIVHWMSEEEFKSLFRELHYIAGNDDFVAMFNTANSSLEKARIAIAAFRSFAAYSDDSGIQTSLEHALRALDHIHALDAVEQRRVLNEVKLVMRIAQLKHRKPPLVAAIPKIFELAQFNLADAITLVNYRSERFVIPYKQKLLKDVETRVSKLEEAPADNGNAGSSGFKGEPVLLLERLALTEAVYGKPDEVLTSIKDLIATYPDNARLALAEAVLAARSGPARALLPKLKQAAANIESRMLRAAKLRSLSEFRRAMADYEVHAQSGSPVEANYVVWQTMVMAGRRLSERAGMSKQAVQFAKQELFGVYADSDKPFCKTAASYAQTEKSAALKTIVRRVRATGWYGGKCRDQDML